MLGRFSCVRFFATPWTVAHQAPLFMGFSRQEYWSGLSFPPPEDLPDLGIEPGSPALQTDSLPCEPYWLWSTQNNNKKTNFQFQKLVLIPSALRSKPVTKMFGGKYGS